MAGLIARLVGWVGASPAQAVKGGSVTVFALLLLLLAGGGLYSCKMDKARAEINDLSIERDGLARDLDRVIAVNYGLARDIGELEAEQTRRDEAILYKDGIIHDLNKKFEAQRAEIARAGELNPEYRNWAPLPLPDFACGLLGQSAAPGSGRRDQDNQAGPAPGAAGSVSSPGLAGQD